MSEPLPRCVRCLKRHLGRCAAYAVIGSIAFVPASLAAKDGNLPDDFALPTTVVTGTTTATGTWTVQQYNPDTMLDREVSAPGPGYHSMQAAVPGETVQKIVYWGEPKKPDKA